MTIKSLAHVCIKTTDLQATTDFYCGALGMTKHFNFTRNGQIIGFYMRASHNDTFVEVFHADAIEGIDKHVLSHFCLETESLEELREQLIERGYSPRAIKMGADKTPQFWMKDPNGLELEFQEYRPESAQTDCQGRGSRLVACASTLLRAQLGHCAGGAGIRIGFFSRSDWLWVRMSFLILSASRLRHSVSTSVKTRCNWSSSRFSRYGAKSGIFISEPVLFIGGFGMRGWTQKPDT